jgi:CRP-like cAMP-binding protein
MPTGKSMSNESVRDVLDRMASPVSFPNNSVVFSQGDAPVGVYVVRKGAVRMTVKAGESDLLLSIA